MLGAYEEQKHTSLLRFFSVGPPFPFISRTSEGQEVNQFFLSDLLAASYFEVESSKYTTNSRYNTRDPPHKLFIMPRRGKYKYRSERVVSQRTVCSPLRAACSTDG